MKSRVFKTWRRAPVLVSVCLFLALPAAAEGESPCTKLWVEDDGGGHTWHDEESWDPEGVPGPADIACILLDGNYRVTVSSPVTVAGLKLDVGSGTIKLKIIDTDFTLNGHGHIAGDTKLKVNDGATLRTDGAGLLEIESILVIEGGTVETDVDLYGHLNWWGSASLTGKLTTFPGSRIEVEDPLAEAHLMVAQGFENNGDLILNDLIGQSLTVSSGSLINSSGGTISTLSKSESLVAVPELRAVLVNHGLIDIDGLDLLLTQDGSDHENTIDGTIEVSGAELEIDLVGVTEAVSNFTNRGTIRVAGGGTIRVRGTANTTEAVSNFTNRGTIRVAGGGTIRVRGSASESAPGMAFVNHGTITMETIAVTASLLDMEGVVFQPEDGSIGGVGEMLLVGSQISGSTAYTNQIDLTVAGSSVDAGIGLSNTGSMVFQGESTVSGSFRNQAAAQVIIEGSDDHGPAAVQFASGLDNDGSLVLGSSAVQAKNAHLTVDSGALEIGPSGTLGLVDGAGGDRRITGELSNHGEVTVSGADLLLDGGGRSHTNDGTINVSGAQLEIVLDDLIEVVSNFTNRGTTMVAGAGTIRVRGSASKGLSGSFQNAGILDIDSGATVTMESVGFENQASGEVGGSGELDVSQAATSLFNGHLSPGSSAGILSIEGNLVEGPSAAISIEIGGATPGTTHDRLDVSGAMSSDGSLYVSLLNAYHPIGGERYEVLTYSSMDGWFAFTMLPSLQHLLSWNIYSEEHALWLEVLCEGTQLGIEFQPDRDPASIGHDLVYQVKVQNHSPVEATDLVVANQLPSELVFRPDLSSPECQLIGSTVECTRPNLASTAVWQPLIGVEPVVAGAVGSTAIVEAWECDVEMADNQATAGVEVVAAEPCDSNFDLLIDPDDLVPAVDHIFGDPADGNPDCRPGNGVTADDLAAIIESSQ